MARLSPEEGFNILKDRVSGAVGDMFPIVGRKHSLELKEVRIKDDLSIDDLRSQKKAKVNKRTWSVPVEAQVALKDVATGKVVDEQTMRLLNLPKTTRRYSQIVDGQEYQVDNQWRLKSGVYARIKDNGELESAFNLAKGRGFSVGFDPEKRNFEVKYGTSKIPLRPLLLEMGIPKEEIEQKWGKQIAQDNSQDPEKALMKFFKASTGSKAENVEQAREHLKKTFGETKMLPEVNKITLGKPYDRVTGSALMDASHKLLQVSQGKAEPDSRDALRFKELHSTEDFVAERLQKGTGAITRRIQNTLDRKRKVREIIGPDIFNRPIRELYRTTLANIPEQTNPLEMISGQMKTTITGEGGIKSAHGITEDAKLVDPSHLGFLDPIHTPEGDTTGVTLRLPIGVQKKGHDVGVTMFNLKTGRNEIVNPEKAMGADVVLPDQVKWVDGKPIALGKSVKMSGIDNDIKEGSLKSAKYVMRGPLQMFSMSTNLVPFLAADHPLRSTMAGRQMEQAISLRDREAPLVQSLAGTKTFESVMGDYAGHVAPASGKVVKITNDSIEIKDDEGRTHERQIYDHFPLNSDKSFMHSTPTVKVGDVVKAKQSIADTNFTRKGQLALGTNLKIGYMPYKGYNFEDGVVISESAAKKLSSEHLYRKSVSTGKNHILSKHKFQAYIPEAMTKEQAEKLDDDGVMRPGTRVMPGDTLVAALLEKTDRTEDKELSKIHKSLVRPYQDASVKWEADQPGFVTEVVKRGKQTAVHVKTIEPMEIGDKLAGRHGNKGIVTKVIPDDEMPKTKEGPLQILLNPCYDDRTEFLTHRGWILGPELRDDDVFGTMNQKTLAIEFQSPEEVYRWPYCGKMYHLASQQLDMMVTPNHRQFVAPRIREALGTIDLTDPPPVFKLEEARDIIGKPRRYLKAGSWSGFDSGSIDIQAGTKGSTGQPGGGFSVPSLLWAEFMGWYLSEGSSYFNKANYGYLVEISQSLINQENRDDIASLLDEMGLNYTTQDSGFVLHHKGLYEKLIVLGGCNAKYIPREVLDLPQKHLSVFLDRFIRGDGSERWNPDTGHYGTLRCSTNSFQLAGGLQEVAMKLGLACNMKEDKRTEKYSDGHHYCLSLSPSRKAPWVNWSEEARKHQVEGWVDYDGIIYCAKVPNGTLVVRRNGIPVISGNTGVPGRTNLGQVLETAAGKIAEKTGRPYVVKNFKPNVDLHAQVVRDLKEHGLTDKETVFDPNGRRLGEVLVGPQHIIKLKHQVEKKMTARAGGPGYAYDRNRIPKGGGPHGAQALGMLGLYSMLAHGAKANLREMQTVKSDAAQGDEFWSALQAGEPLPAPRPTFAYKKFNSYLNALGINVKKEGNNLTLVPFTDKQVEEMSNGVIKDGGKMVRAKDLKPEKGGLFDPKVTGGAEGTKWSHMKLPEPFPNPLFEKSIRSLTGLSSTDFSSLVGGTKALDPRSGKLIDDLDVGVTGGKAIGKMLKSIDVDKELAAAKQRLDRPNLKGNLLDNANKKVKYLVALKKAGLSANDAYMMKNVPVLPPSMRPVSQLPNGDLNVDDVNNMYKGIALSAKQLKGASPLLPEEDKAELRFDIYDGLKSLAGLGGHANREYRGIIDVLAGKRPELGSSKKVGSPKTGFFQSKLVQRKQDLSMRSTIIPEPSLGLDEVALPRRAATELYKPFIVRELRGMTGASPLKAQQMVREGGSLVNRALERVIEKRPVLLKRDPVLHKHGIQAFKPRITGGKAIKVHPLVTSGFNADFNGDSCNPATLLLFSVDGEIRFESFWELSQILLPGSTIDGQVDLAAGGTAILRLDSGLKVLSRVPGKGMRWVDVSAFTVHASHGSAFDVRTHIGRSVNVSEHHNFAVVDDALICRKTKTDELCPGQLIPFAREFDTEVLDHYEFIAGREVELDWESGWFFGYFAGDGSVTGRKDTVSLACGDNGKHPLLAESFEHLGFSWWDEPDRSVRSTDKKFAAYMLQFGHGAPNKTVPSFVFGAPREFREGFVAGLLDAESNVYIDVNGALHVRMEVTSYLLIEGLSWLLASLGIGCYFRKGKEPTSKTLRTYVLEVSRDDLDRLPMYKFTEKAEALHNGLGRARSVERSAYDLVPFCNYLAELFVERGVHQLTNRVPSPYKSKEIRKYGKLGYLTRKAALRVMTKYGPVADDIYHRWAQFVEDTSVGWTLVDSVKETDRPDIMYDFSVPDGDETFAVAGGLITRNTMSAFVPVSVEAIEEAERMFPSNNLFNPATGGLMYKPTLESQLGLYGISQIGKKTGKKFNNIKEVESAHRKGEIGFNDQIKVGKLDSTTGKFMVAGALPDKMRRSFLKSKAALNKERQSYLLQELAEEYRNDYGSVVNELKDLGNQWSTETAFSIGLDDIKPEKVTRRAILAKAERNIAASGTKGEQRDSKAIQEFDKATQEMHKKLDALPESKSALMIMHKSGIKPTMDTLRQIKMAPMLIANAKGETIPTPAKRSYSEGLDLADYWTSMSGARKGIIQKVQTVREPGYISKMVMNSTMNNSILDDDCDAPAGINLSIDEKDVLDRYLALDVKAGKQTFKRGTLITPDVRSSMRNNKVRRVPVRTPLKCQHGPGMCRKCYGLTEDGREPDIGLNVGVLSGQALGERATQLSMKAFHCNHADSIVFVREDDDYSILAPTLEDLFDMVDGGPIVEGEEEVKKVEGWQIWDGRWVSLTHVRRHKPDRPMMLVSDRHLVTICQDNHPIGVWRNNVVCEECGYHRFKDPHKSRRQYCAKCGHAQEAPDQKLGDAGFLSPAELEAGKYYLRRSTPNIVLSSREHPTFDPYFVGMFLAEGCVVWKRSCKEQRAKRPYQIQISQQPGAVRDEILRRGAAYQLKEKPRYLAVDNVKMGQEFHDLFGRYARHKSLPCDFLDYSEEWLDDMLAGIIDGDGTILRTEDGPPAIAIDTTSFALAQQIVFICMYSDLRAGIVATSERPLTRHQGYQVRIGMTRAAMARLSSSLKVQKLLEEDYPSPEYESAEFNLVGAVREVLYTHKYVYDATTETGTLCVSGLKHHNTGGTASSKEGLVDEFERVKNLLLFPKTLPGSATLSTINGTVSRVQKDPAGGYNVFVRAGQDDVRHYVPQKRGSPMVGGKLLHRGSRVKKGMAISKGPVNPHEMLPLTGVEPVQGYLSDELHGIYGAHGIRRRNTEVVVKALTNLTQIEDPGDHDSFIRGDFAPTSLVANKNRQVKGRRPIVHRPVLKGVNVLPLDMQEDWMARMNHENLKATVVGAAQQGWTSRIQGKHPIPPVVAAVGLGRSKPGEY